MKERLIGMQSECNRRLEYGYDLPGREYGVEGVEKGTMGEDDKRVVWSSRAREEGFDVRGAK